MVIIQKWIKKEKSPPPKKKKIKNLWMLIFEFLFQVARRHFIISLFLIWFWIGISDINGANSAWLNLNRKPKVQSTLRVTLLVPGMHNQKTKTLKKKLCMNYDTLRFLPYDHLVSISQTEELMSRTYLNFVSNNLVLQWTFGLIFFS